jgi:DNA-binding NtrC family response regulator/tetratricopeptide (TPR) repeat protein
MLLSLDVGLAGDSTLHSLRSLVARGRHAEADQVARGWRGRRSAHQARLFLALRAEIALGLGRFAAALDWVRQALKGLEVCDAFGRSLEGSRIRALIGLGRFREAQSIFQTLDASDGPGRAELRLFEAHVALHSGRLAEASRAASEACSASVSSGQRLRLVEALVLRARASREGGEVRQAQSDLDRAQRLSNGLRDTSVLANVLADRADLLAHSGDWAEAAKNASQSGRLFARTFSPHEHLSAGRRTGLLGLAQGDPFAALPSIEKAAELAGRGFGTTEGRAEIDLLLADAQLAGRNPEGALERATAALAFFRHAQDQGGLARAHVRRSLAALSASNLTLALREARIARAIQGAGPVAEALADLALGRALLRKEPASARAPFERAAENPSLYPPLCSVARLGAALARGASPCSDTVLHNLQRIEGFGDRRILSIVRTDLREMFGVEFADGGSSINEAIIQKPEGDLEGEGDEVTEFLPGLIGVSPAVRHLSGLVRKAAPHDVPVSIYGETGTGKENVAKAIHSFSTRAGRKFVAVNAAGLSDELFDSQIFGHARGSFTGAQTDRPGLVEEAKGGTLFIDEVADLSPRSQVALLRFVQDGKYRRLGENHERHADVRIVVAANQPLSDLVKAGRFREDLLHRLQGIGLTVPPLRERGRYILRLARHFVARASGRRAGLTPEAESEIVSYSWPGNVRQLEQAMTCAVVLADSARIDWKRPATQAAPPGPSLKKPGEALLPESLREALGGYERRLLKSVLSRGLDRVEAARLLGISRQALHQKIARYGL